MTDKEIIKALDECLSFEMVEMMTDLKLSDVVDLITRLQQEKDTYEARNKALRTERNRLNDKLNSTINGQETLQGYVAKQDKEIERLKAKCENTQIGYNFAKTDIERLKKDKYKLQKALNQSEDYRVIAKAEAYKEFAGRLKPKFKNIVSCNAGAVYCKIDNLLKEMVGDNNV